ncbi:MAG: hypothetical protein DYG89_40745 [Caldilinea sp. CFX5]|nr:hypothetical protein [Caldilinea sp. CFX5]
MIDLAPGHKTGLIVKSPVLLAGGSVGYGEAMTSGVDVKALGAVVVGPLLRQSGSGIGPPRVAELTGGMVLGVGAQNRGVNDVVKRFARPWARLGAPVIVQVAESRPSALTFVLERLAPVPAVAGIELLIGNGTDAEVVQRAIYTTMQISDLPIWVKLPLAAAVQLAPVAVAAGAVGIVVGQPPPAAALRAMPTGAPALVQGTLYGPVVYHLMFAALLAVSKLALPAALIACGGIHTAEQARTVLQIPGVRALQIDSALWIEPGLPGRLATALLPST